MGGLRNLTPHRPPPTSGGERNAAVFFCSICRPVGARGTKLWPFFKDFRQKTRPLPELVRSDKPGSAPKTRSISSKTRPVPDLARSPNLAPPQNALNFSLKTGCSFFRPRNVFFQTARLVHLVFGRGMSFFRPPAFFQTAMRPRKKAQSFFQPDYFELSFPRPRNIL